MSEHEEMLICKTSFILGKDTSQMKLNDIIEELVKVIDKKLKSLYETDNIL
ncbi:hypothetical protein [Neobacillus cucumis]|uniref:hypothetical protein n=1 Tax=Neobacillus cucumis TaxID=1740721 RepID=UPI002E1E9CF3|nr:hypothetical protein [Neobacillus cucumis]